MANGRVLIIDDEKNYLLILQAILEDEGYEVTTINDPEMVMPYLEDSEVDVVITDMKMPKITGKELLEHVKKNYPRLPVLIMTAFGSIESAVEVMRHGAFDYITKPFANDELLLSLHNAMELSKPTGNTKSCAKAWKNASAPIRSSANPKPYWKPSPLWTGLRSRNLPF